MVTCSLGVTGSVACGKSTVAKQIAALLDAQHVDADQIVRDIQRSDRSAWEELAEFLPGEAFSDTGMPDRSWLRNAVFSDPSLRAKVEAVIHPRVRSRWMRELENARVARRSIVVEIPLLFEVGAESAFDHTVGVGASRSVQLARLAERGLAADLANAIIDSQMPLDRKLALADYSVWNDSCLEVLSAQVDLLANRLNARIRS